MTVSVSSRTLLVVEDSDEDFEATLRTLKKIGATATVLRCISGDDALDRLFHRGIYSAPGTSPAPSLILLDLNLPTTDGREVLEQIKHDETLSSIPVVVLTTSSNQKDIDICYRNGANSYLLKPVNLQLFTNQLKLMYDYWFNAVLLPEPLR